MPIAANDNSAETEISRHTTGALRAVTIRISQARAPMTRRKANGYLPALDDASLATFGRDRRDLERDARRPFFA